MNDHDAHAGPADSVRWANSLTADEAHFSVVDKLHCVERELRHRYRVYARMVAGGQMSERKRNREIALMEEIAADLRAAAEQIEPDVP